MTSAAQRFTLVLLRTLIGWHFLYEGYTKLLFPAWGRTGAPVARWSSAAYLKAATGPFADVFHTIGNSSWIGTLDLVVAIALVLVGLSLMLGFFTQTGCVGAIGLLAMFYLSAMPVGLPEARAEGTYLFVNKNLIEAAAVLAIFTFRTGRIAGLDSLWVTRAVRGFAAGTQLASERSERATRTERAWRSSAREPAFAKATARSRRSASRVGGSV